MKVIVDNIVTEYSDEGIGPVFLLLHGWKDTLHTFDLLTTFLLRKCRVVRLDLPGFGGTEPPSKAWYLDDYVRFVKDFCAKVHIQSDVIIGHSFGGRIAIKAISSGAINPRKLVLISSAGVAKRRTFRNRFLSISAKIGKVITIIPPLTFWRKQLRRKLYQAIGSDYFESGSLKNTFLNVINEDLSSCAPKITVDTLLIWGDEDKATLPAEGVILSELIPHSKLEMITGASHFVHKEYPEKVAELILNHTI